MDWRALYRTLKPYGLALLGAGLAYLERYFSVAETVYQTVTK